MASTFFSKSWYLVAQLKVRLRANTALHRHSYRNDLAYLLEDELSGQYYRLTPQVYQLLSLMDGRQTVDDIWEWGCEHLEDDMPTQNELISVLYNLFRANVLHTDEPPDIDALGRRISENKKRGLIQKLKSPMGIKVPFWDPEQFLQRTFPWVRRLFGLGGFLLWLSVVVVAILLASKHWVELTSNASDKVLSADNLILILLLYPLIKALHELGHAYMVKRWHGEVHEIGIMFLVFFPVPYVDASAATGFSNKYARMLVGAAGILVEIFIAAAAMILWVYVEPGVVRAAAFNTMLIAGVSTLLFNGNPLLRFDAYYILADYLEIPNLSSRSNKYIWYLVKRYVWRLPEQLSPARTIKESFCLASYSILSFLYRMVIMTVIALYVAQTFFFVGVVLAIWVLSNAIVIPVIGGVWKVFSEHQWQGARVRVSLIGGIICSAIVMLIAIVPMPYATNAQGILWATEEAAVHTGEAGFVGEVLVKHGQSIERGGLLLRLENQQLTAESLRLKAQLQEARSQYQISKAGAANQRANVTIELEILKFREGEYERILTRLEQLNVRAHMPGRIVMPKVQSLVGKYLERGELLAHIVDDKQVLALAFVDQDDIEPVRTDVQDVGIRLVSDLSTTLDAKIVRRMPASSYELPSEVLTVEGGGIIARDSRSATGLKSFNPYYRLELALLNPPIMMLNQRFLVRIAHTPEPLMYRWYRDIRRLFLRQLDV